MDGPDQLLAAERLRADAEMSRQRQEALRQAQEQVRARAEAARADAEGVRLAAVKEVNGTVATMKDLLERMEAVEKMRRRSRSSGFFE